MLQFVKSILSRRCTMIDEQALSDFSPLDTSGSGSGDSVSGMVAIPEDASAFYEWMDTVTSGFVESTVPQLTGCDIDSLVVISKSYIDLLLNYAKKTGDASVLSKAVSYLDSFETIKKKIGY